MAKPHFEPEVRRFAKQSDYHTLAEIDYIVVLDYDEHIALLASFRHWVHPNTTTQADGITVAVQYD